MKLINKTKNLVIAEDVKVYRNLFDRFKGLMFSNLGGNKAVILESQKESIDLASIHTCFVFFPLSVIWLDKDFKVVDVKLNIRPFSLLIKPQKAAKYVVEMKKDNLNVDLGNILELR